MTKNPVAVWCNVGECLISFTKPRIVTVDSCVTCAWYNGAVLTTASFVEAVAMCFYFRYQSMFLAIYPSFWSESVPVDSGDGPLQWWCVARTCVESVTMSTLLVPWCWMRRWSFTAACTSIHHSHTLCLRRTLPSTTWSHISLCAWWRYISAVNWWSRWCVYLWHRWGDCLMMQVTWLPDDSGVTIVW